MGSARKSKPVAAEQLARTRVSLIRFATLIVDAEPEQALIIDLGLNGVFIERLQPPPLAAKLRVSFKLPGNELPLEADCRVAWRHDQDRPLHSKQLPPGLGLQFVGLPEAERGRLRSYLEQHFKRSPRARQFTRPWIDEEEDPLA